MENILIINFKRYGDIISMAHLLHSLKQNYPSASISLLIFSEFAKATQSLKYVSQVFVIDRKKIASMKKNRLFSKSMPINEFSQEIKLISEKKWDHVINFSNDLMGTYLLSYLSPDNFSGVIIKNDGQILHSNKWALVFNEVLTEFSPSPIHFVDCYHKMINLNFIDEEIKIHTNPENNKVAYENFKNLKKRLSLGTETKIVALQLKSSSLEKDIPKQTIIDLLKEIQNDKRFYPIILFAPNSSEEEMVVELNSLFDNSLLSIEADLPAVPSVLLNVDILITPDTSIKHYSDLVSTPVIEVSRGPSPWQKQGTINSYNLILRENRINDEDPEFIRGEDIFQTLKMFFDFLDFSQISLSKNITLYQAQKDSHGIWYRYLSGKKNPYFELSRNLSRYYLYKIIEDVSIDNIFKQMIHDHSRDDIYKWIDYEKDKMTSMVRALLNTIKTLKAYKFKSGTAKDFISSLDSLLVFCESKSLVALPVLMFRGKLESLLITDIDYNLKSIEALLYGLKNEIQTLTNILTKLTSFEYEQRKSENQRSEIHEGIES